MKTKLVYIERKLLDFVSIERVFKSVANALPGNKYEIFFEKLHYGSGLGGIIRNLLSFRKTDADIFHITGHVHFIALRLPFENTVLTIHDLRILHTNSGLRRYFLKKFFLDWPLRRAKYITAISTTTRDDIVRLSGCAADRVRVIENPLTIEFNETKGSFNDECPTILQVGTGNHKNLDNLAVALKGLKCRLEIVGQLSEAQREQLERNNIVYSTSENLDDDEMISRYLSADVLAFCSTFEGFGLPIIEAQALGLPVITSNIDPMTGVAGDGAILVNPLIPNEIRDAVKSIVADKDLRDSLVEKGRVNVRRYSPETIAKKYDALYTELLEANQQASK